MLCSVGKTSILERYLRGDEARFTDSYLATIGCEFYSKDLYFEIEDVTWQANVVMYVIGHDSVFFGGRGNTSSAGVE